MIISKKYVVMSAVAVVGLSAIVFGSGYVVSGAANVPDRFIVTFEDGNALNEKARVSLENAGGQVVKSLNLVNGFVVLIPEQAVGRIADLSGVKVIEKDALVFTQQIQGISKGKPSKGGGGGGSTQPAETLEWGVNRIDADLAWSASRGSGVNVAIIDTGIDRDHADLIGNIKGGINFVSSGPSWKRTSFDKWDDDNGHGTHVAGIVAAIDNEIGVIGVAPEARLYAIKTLDRNGSGYLSNIIEGIEWSIDNGMNIINMSLGCNCDSAAFKDAVDRAYNAGIVLVAAAGNSGDGNGSTNNVSYPAKYSSVIAVSAVANDDSISSWSSDGEEVEFAAPGVNIKSTWNNGLYDTISGTSMASPHVAGTIALILATTIPSSYDANNDGAWNPSEVREVLKLTADDLGSASHDNFYGHGLIDAEESVIGSETNQ